MATPPDSPVDDGAFELEPSRAAIKHRPVALEDLCRQTKFSRHEIRVMYRGFKQASFQPLNTTPCTQHAPKILRSLSRTHHLFTHFD
jgi:hypothetical protein